MPSDVSVEGLLECTRSGPQSPGTVGARIYVWPPAVPADPSLESCSPQTRRGCYCVSDLLQNRDWLRLRFMKTEINKLLYKAQRRYFCAHCLLAEGTSQPCYLNVFSTHIKSTSRRCLMVAAFINILHLALLLRYFMPLGGHKTHKLPKGKEEFLRKRSRYLEDHC